MTPGAAPGARTFAEAHLTEEGRKVAVAQEDVDRIHVWVRQHPWTKALEVDREDCDLVARYLAQANRSLLPRLTAGGALGASLFLHEYSEAKFYIENGVTELFDDDAREELYDLAHGTGLIEEHKPLFALAKANDFDIRDMGALMYWNPIVVMEPVHKRENELIRASRVDGYIDIGVDIDYDNDGPKVKAFYDWIAAGKPERPK